MPLLGKYSWGKESNSAEDPEFEGPEFGFTP